MQTGTRDGQGSRPVRDSRIHEYRQHAWRVERRKKLIEAEGQARLEVEREERARLHRLENSRIEKLLHESMSLRLADDIRSYVEAVNTRNSTDTDPVPEEQMAEWSQWARAQADRIDPVRTGAFLQPPPDPEKEEEASACSTRAPPSPASPGPSAPLAWHPNRWYTRLHR
ncbi:hypothetical protein [Luteimonas kalidii]|uniref:Uncharacterized protein n=1 Tax=Luteimonas kalidii TaxID=3042025 RepID=A0ABT6JXW7_9GAMM|nr:hypothetical protein [Luteimonas kalidii]MDH5835317.1 hypothetical protein [Luteimonas kalidii]